LVFLQVERAKVYHHINFIKSGEMAAEISNLTFFKWRQSAILNFKNTHF